MIRQNKKYLLVFFVIVLAASAAVYRNKPADNSKKQSSGENAANNITCPNCNVVLISVDSLRADHIGAFGYKRNTTPNLDKLVKRGFLFLNNFNPSFITPVSEASLMTGLFPTSHGVANFNMLLPKTILTMPQYLKGNGYETSALLSSPEFMTNPAMLSSFSRGFDKYEYSNQEYLHDYYNNSAKARAVPNLDAINSKLDYFNGKKFFLWLGIGTVHWPYGKNIDEYGDKNYSGVFKGKTLDWRTFQNVYKGIVYPEKLALTNADVQYIIDQYDNGIKTFDAFLGQFVGELKKRGLFKNTIVILESEHGEDLNEHGYFAHYDIMDTQVHTPLFIFVPSSQKGAEISSLISSVDVFPTLIELLGDRVPKELQGKSLLPIISGNEQDGRRNEVYIERNPLWEELKETIRYVLQKQGIKIEEGKYKDIAIRTPEWKYILRTAGERVEKISWWAYITGKPITVPKEELYNLIKDPLETKNVVGEEPEKAAEFRKKVNAWYAKISQTAPKKIEYIPSIQPYF